MKKIYIYFCEPQLITIRLKSAQFPNLVYQRPAIDCPSTQHTDSSHFERDVMKIIHCIILYNITLKI